MRNARFDMRLKKVWGRGADMHVSAEHYGSAQEVLTVGLRRRLGQAAYADKFERDPSNPEWSGFKSKEDLRDRIVHGITDDGIITQVNRGTAKIQCKDVEKLAQKVMNVAGGCPDVPTFLASVPVCMHSMARKRVKKRIIEILVPLEVVCTVSIEDYKAVGTLICEQVAMLEKMGYRVRITTCDALSCDPTHLSVLCVNIKHENEPMNLKRILFPLTDMAFFRGLVFSWAARKPDYPFSGLGGYVDSWFDSIEQMDDMFRKSAGQPDAVIFRLHELIDYYGRFGEEKTRKLLLMKVSSVM